MENRSLGRLLELRRQVAAGGPLSTREYDLEIHGRLSLIFACLVFSLLAAPVALRFGRGQSLAGILATLVVAFVYYVVMMGMRVLGGNGVLPVPVAAWAENVVVLGLSLWGMRRF
jgi:lipopolysaccharide export system permease protein